MIAKTSAWLRFYKAEIGFVLYLFKQLVGFSFGPHGLHGPRGPHYTLTQRHQQSRN
jgi:hypothetical protein